MGDGLTALDYFRRAGLAAASQLFLLLGPLLLFAFLMNHLAGFVEKRARRWLGHRLFLFLFGWLGTAVHELGHALFCVLFGHRITRLQLFSFSAENGQQGCVDHSYNPRNPWHVTGQFFIGMGPVILGAAVIFLCAWLLLGGEARRHINPDVFHGFDPSTWEGMAILLRNTWRGTAAVTRLLFEAEHLRRWQFYLFIYLVFSVGSSVTLSRADFRQSAYGLLAVVLLLFFFNLATLWAGGFAGRVVLRAASLGQAVYGAMIFTLVLNALAAALVFLIAVPAALLRRVL